jgi:hypothetical protein
MIVNIIRQAHLQDIRGDQVGAWRRERGGYWSLWIECCLGGVYGTHRITAEHTRNIRQSNTNARKYVVTGQLTHSPCAVDIGHELVEVIPSYLQTGEWQSKGHILYFADCDDACCTGQERT